MDIPQAEVSANVQSIDSIPRSVLPDGEARSYLVQQAQAGEDCYAYTSAGPAQHWNIWLRVNRYAASEWTYAYAGGVR